MHSKWNKAIHGYKKYFVLFMSLLFLFTSCSSKNKKLSEAPFFEAETAFKEADDLAKKGYYEKAREILENVKVQDTTGENAPLAQIRIGDTYFDDNQFEEAVVEYEHFLHERPNHKYAPYAQYKLAMSYYKRIDAVDLSYEMARKSLNEFERLLTLYPRNPYVSVAENRIKACYRMLAEYELYVGKFYFKKESYAAAAGRFNDMLQKYPDSKKEAEALYYLGLSYKNMGERHRAVEILTTLVEKYPTAELSRDAKEIIASLRSEK